MMMKHFVFGYGSLICPESRAITAPSLAGRDALPVTVRNVERTWAKQSKKLYTAMGVRFRDGAECVGVLVPVNDTELDQFDGREIGYDRYPIHSNDVLQVPFLEDDHYENTFLEDDTSMEALKIWVYVQRNPVPPTPQYPIAQAYVDIILRGCLTISEEFAQEFIQTTKGWDPSELQEDSEDDSDDEDWWVDDRRDPLYVRADQEYSLENAKELDKLLRHNRKEDFGNRVRKGREEVKLLQ
jgi:hypothetical protein